MTDPNHNFNYKIVKKQYLLKSLASFHYHYSFIWKHIKKSQNFLMFQKSFSIVQNNVSLKALIFWIWKRLFKEGGALDLNSRLWTLVDDQRDNDMNLVCTSVYANHIITL